MQAGTFLGELKRRNVLLAGAFYVAAVCALAQEIVDHLEAALASFREVAAELPKSEARE
ncbi:MAG: hypothetical protein ABI351_02915 [Herbaspirillum sp.]